jgi:hypothetical protein
LTGIPLTATRMTGTRPGAIPSMATRSMNRLSIAILLYNFFTHSFTAEGGLQPLHRSFLQLFVL